MPQAPAPVATGTPPANTAAPVGRSAPSQARTPREYRADAARHLYAHNSHRIFKGKLPPLLYAVGVLQVHLDAQGMVSSLSWMRAPNHVPAVKADIERTVRQAAPYPVSAALGRVIYTDTWLWDRSGKFQLDTLTEGQLSEMPERKAAKPVPTSAAVTAKANAGGAGNAPSKAPSKPLAKPATRVADRQCGQGTGKPC